MYSRVKWGRGFMFDGQSGVKGRDSMISMGYVFGQVKKGGI